MRGGPIRSRRKKPFSGAQKKQQLKAKRAQRRHQQEDDEIEDANENTTEVETDEVELEDELTESPVETVGKSKRQIRDQRRQELRTQLRRQNDEEVEKGKEESQLKMVDRRGARDGPGWPLLEEECELVKEMSRVMGGLPVRPDWQAMGLHSLRELRRAEKKVFKIWRKKLYGVAMNAEKRLVEEITKGNRIENEEEIRVEVQQSFDEDSDDEDDVVDMNNPVWFTRVNQFEQNVEVWRQLWMTVEQSDIVAWLFDARYAMFHLHAALYDFICHVMHRPLVLVLNKIDLLEPEDVDKLVEYLERPELLSHNGKPLPVVVFSSRYIDPAADEEERKRIRKSNRFGTYGSEQFLSHCGKALDAFLEQSPQHKRVKRSEERDVVGLIGAPNAGKSSLLNALVQRRVVSTSRTPGHTKHFQTYLLEDNPRWTVRDCPGLVLPLVVTPQMQRDTSEQLQSIQLTTKLFELQVVSALLPLAQLRQPFTAVQFIAERSIPTLQEHYDLKLEDSEWSAWAICEQYALKHGYLTGKAGRPDVYRAANVILKDAVDGRIRFYFLPPV